jgi:hypothetical protein
MIFQGRAMNEYLGSGKICLGVESFFDYISNRRIRAIRQKKRAAEMTALSG